MSRFEACTVGVDVKVMLRIGLVGTRGVYGGIIRMSGVRELRA